MQTQIPRSLIPTALLLLCSCAVPIADYQFCSPIPGNLGAVCDQFLTSNQQILDEAQWLSLQASWNASGQAVECTGSDTLGSLKEELETLCSRTACNYEAAAAVKQVSEALAKIEALGKPWMHNMRIKPDGL